MQWMIYGATGYTGRLVTEIALARGHRPVLAGRDADTVAALARARGLEHRSFDLRDADWIADQLAGVDVVAHCAGPFSATSAPMVRGCVRAGTHYLDITGEIDVFEDVFAQHDAARRAGVTLLPGAGFDVVPSDCLAALVARQLPHAHELDLAVRTSGGLSRGTLRSAWEGAAWGGRARIAGELRTVPFGWRVREVPFPAGTRRVTSLPWGDVSSAYYSTGIGDITAFTQLPAMASRVGHRATRLLRAVAGTRPVQRAGRALIDAAATSPSDAARARSQVEVYAEARDTAGKAVGAALRGPDPYDFTADSVVQIVERLRRQDAPTGARTPSMAFGADVVRDIQGVTLREPAATAR